MYFLAEEIREIMAKLGIRKMDHLIGRTDLLEVRDFSQNEKYLSVDWRKIIEPIKNQRSLNYSQKEMQNHGLSDILDKRLIELAQPALTLGKKVNASLNIQTNNRSTATMLSGVIAKKFGAQGLMDHTICFHFKGFSGQSFGAFLSPGIFLQLEGAANDYLGKGMSGGIVIVKPDPSCPRTIGLQETHAYTVLQEDKFTFPVVSVSGLLSETPVVKQ